MLTLLGGPTLALLAGAQVFGQRAVDTNPLAITPEAPAVHRRACITVCDALDHAPAAPGGEVWVVDEGGVSPATMLPDGSFWLEGLGEKVTLEFSHPFYGKGQLQLYLGDSKFCHVTVALGSGGATLLSCARSTTERAVYELKGSAPAVRAGGAALPRPAPATKLGTKASSQALSKTLDVLDLPCLAGDGDESDAPIPVGAGVFAGDLADNTGSLDLDSSGFNNTIDEWLCYVASCTGDVTVTTCRPGTQFDTVLSVWSGGAEISANDDTLGSPEACSLGGLNRFSTVVFRAVSGEPYLIRVSAFNDAFAGHGSWGTDYEVAIECAPLQLGVSNCCSANGGIGCDDAPCQSAVCDVDDFCCSVAWDQLCADQAQDICSALCNGGGGGGSDCCFPNGGIGCDDPACQSAVCDADAFCCDVAWDQLCADAAVTQLCVALCNANGGECSGDGEECETALQAVTGDNSGSTIGNSGLDVTSCTPQDRIDEWWCWTADCNGTATASTCNQADFDTALAVFAGCGGTELVCNDDTAGCGGFSTVVTWSVTAGTEYKIRVAGWNLSSGTYTLTLSCEGEGGPSNCCVANGGIGCDNPNCEGTVCAVDAFCCDVAWDQLCADQAADLCGDLCGGAGPCGPPNAQDCFVPGSVPGCSDADCCETVCAADAFCCDVSWDGLCAGAAVSLCQQVPVGACCNPIPGLTDPCVDGFTEAQCESASGVWQGQGTICSETNCDGVPNDECDDALTLSLGDTASGTTTGATIDSDAPNCPGGAGISAPGVWYSVIGTGTTLVATTCNGASYDTQINVYCGECREDGNGEPSNCCFPHPFVGCDDPTCQSMVCAADNFCCDVQWDTICANAALASCGVCSTLPGLSSNGLVCVGANDDFCGLQSSVQWCSEAGVEYLILVHGFGGQTGTFDLSVFELTSGPCTPTVQCGEVTGACCICDVYIPAEDQTCIEATADGCAGLGGTYLGDGSQCAGGEAEYFDPVGLAIPDNNPSGVSDTLSVPDSFTITDVNIDLTINHTWVGDLCVEVEHGGTTVRLIQRPGVVAGIPCHANGPFGCAQDNYAGIILDDEGGGGTIESACALNLTSPPNYTPFDPLSAFNGLGAAGPWTITVSDNGAADLGTLVSWSLHFETAGANPCDALCVGACCFLDGNCLELTEEDCNWQWGAFQGLGTSCEPNPCVGACCFPNGDCQELTAQDCFWFGGVFQGLGTSCEPNPCPQPGACCICHDAQQCIEALEGDCAWYGGTFLGEGSSCDAPTLGPNGYYNPCIEVCCLTIEFEITEGLWPIPNGWEVNDSLYPSLFTLQSGGFNAGPAIFDSTPGGPNQESDDPDLLVDTGNLLILQNNLHANQCGPDIFCTPDDDSTPGGIIRFNFQVLVHLRSVDLIDIDEGAAMTVRLYDDDGRTRTYAVEDGFSTEDQGGIRTLDLTVLGEQEGEDGDAFGTQQSGFNQHRVVRLDFNFGGSAAIDNLVICPKEADEDPCIDCPD